MIKCDTLKIDFDERPPERRNKERKYCMMIGGAMFDANSTYRYHTEVKVITRVVGP